MSCSFDLESDQETVFSLFDTNFKVTEMVKT